VQLQFRAQFLLLLLTAQPEVNIVVVAIGLMPPRTEHPYRTIQGRLLGYSPHAWSIFQPLHAFSLFYMKDGDFLI
jgi:hypothetical protein